MNIEDGWVNLMNQTLIQRETDWRLINASISGETTTGGLKRLPELLQEYSPEIVVLELGGNDGLRGYPTAKILDNLLAMATLVNRAGAKPVIITMRIPPNWAALHPGLRSSLCGGRKSVRCSLGAISV